MARRKGFLKGPQFIQRHSTIGIEIKAVEIP